MSEQSPPKRHTKEEVLQWIEQYQQTQDEEAQSNIVLHFERLVYSLAGKYSKGRQYHEDLVQVGMLGLLGAIRRYDSTLGHSFESFAIPTIIGEIKRFMRDKTWSIHVPRRIKELSPKIKAAVETLTIEFQRSPQIYEIAEYIEVSEEEVLEAMETGRSYQALSMDYSLNADAEGAPVTLFELVGKTDKGYEMADQRLLVMNAIDVLTDREKQVIQYTFIEQLNQKETGDILGISQMHVSRLQRKAILKLKEEILERPGGEEL